MLISQRETIGKPPFSGQKCCSALCSFPHSSSSPAGASCAPHAGVHLVRHSRSPQSPGRAWHSTPPAWLCAPASPRALAEEEALPEGVLSGLQAPAAEKALLLLPQAFCFFSPIFSTAEVTLCRRTGHDFLQENAHVSRWQSCCMGCRSWSPCGCRLVFLWPSAQAPWPPTARGLPPWAHIAVAICTGTTATRSLWSPPWVCGPVTVCTGTTSTHSNVTSPGDEMPSCQDPCAPRLPHPKARTPALPGTASLPAGSAVPGQGSSKLQWAAAPCSLALRFPAAPGADEQLPSL